MLKKSKKTPKNAKRGVKKRTFLGSFFEGPKKRVFGPFLRESMALPGPPISLFGPFFAFFSSFLGEGKPQPAPGASYPPKKHIEKIDLTPVAPRDSPK